MVKRQNKDTIPKPPALLESVRYLKPGSVPKPRGTLESMDCKICTKPSCSDRVVKANTGIVKTTWDRTLVSWAEQGPPHCGSTEGVNSRAALISRGYSNGWRPIPSPKSAGSRRDGSQVPDTSHLTPIQSVGSRTAARKVRHSERQRRIPAF